ncbi:Uncharacterised protein [Legionella lansingensis]|uniref:Uncharacterized protein n=1 Tax=Legionella lansingensis TaxID=45067 RepID=A0A0W0VNV0_9GAMM|nr:hypothetical protein [Legionella lansingensis]KTD21401.1 hypothetical protein Llan_1564 [Legionella lansingensis]SNV51905.1 Uncharacterised protein [Legionella lansingensis]
MSRIPTEGSHFTVNKQPDFIEDSFPLTLTEESKELFEKGADGQGYIGIVEVDTGRIHLVPSFNKGDGLLHLDKNGKQFSRWIATEQPLGGGAGDLHTRAASILKLGHKAGKEGLLMGFGLWKSGVSVKFLSEIPDSNLRLIPDEYLLVKDNNRWILHYVNKDRTSRPIAINAIPGLQEALDQLPPNKKPEELSFGERNVIENLLRHPGNPGIKFAKNRSSSQNMFSCQYTSDYGVFFDKKITGPHRDTQEKIAHQVALRRELPLPVFQKIMDATAQGLAIPLLRDLSSNPVVPTDKNDNYLRQHLAIEKEWINSLKILDTHALLIPKILHMLTEEASEEADSSIIAEMLASLSTKNCLTSETLQALSQFLKYIDQLRLEEHSFDLEKLTVEEKSLVFNKELAVENFVQALITLNREERSKENHFIFEHPLQARNIADGLVTLADAGILTEENGKLFVEQLLTENAKYSSQLLNALRRLASVGELNDGSFKVLSYSKNASYSEALSTALILLSRSRLATEANLQLLTHLFTRHGQLALRAMQKMADAYQLNDQTFGLLSQVELTTSNINNVVKIIETKQQQINGKINQLKEMIYQALGVNLGYHAGFYSRILKNEAIEVSLSHLTKAPPEISLAEMLDWKGEKGPSLREVLISTIPEKSLESLFAKLDSKQIPGAALSG